MKAWDIVGWTYEADMHCPDCAYERFGKALDDDENPPEDSEGNEVHPVFVSDCAEETEHCGDCGEGIWSVD